MKKRCYLAIGLVFSLTASLLAGCQSVDGLETGKILQNAIAVESYEGTHTLTIELTGTGTREGNPELSYLNNATLTLTDVKQQDSETFSAQGEIRYTGGTVPFVIAQADGNSAVLAEGSDKPLLLKEAEPENVAAEDTSASLLSSFDLSGLDWKQLLIDHGETLLQYVPVPDSLTVADADVTINDEALSLKKIHLELTGQDLLTVLHTTLTNIIDDEEDGTALIAAVVASFGLDPDNGLIVLLARQMLSEIAADLSSAVPAEMAAYLENSNSLKLDLYADNQSQLRRLEFELQMSDLNLLDGGVTGLKLTGVSDRWNINQPVVADSINLDDAVLLSQPSGLAYYLKTLDEDSATYKFLVEDLKLTRKRVIMPSLAAGLAGEIDGPYIDIRYDITMVPLRFVSENFDAEVEWLPETRQVLVTDILSGKTLLFSIDSTIVLVDGEADELQAPAIISHDLTYVPAAYIARSFGAVADWDGDTRTVSIIRN